MDVYPALTYRNIGAALEWLEPKTEVDREVRVPA